MDHAIERPADAARADPYGEPFAVSFTATVVARGDADGVLAVEAQGTRYAARRAVGCLVVPEPGDRVACWRGAAATAVDAVHVLAVLDRTSGAPLVLALGPRATVEAGALALATESLEVRATDASFVYRTVHGVAQVAKATAGQLRLAGTALLTAFDQATHHARQHRRTVEGTDTLDAQVVDVRARTLLQLQGENAVVDGERVVKLRGGQVHLG